MIVSRTRVQIFHLELKILLVVSVLNLLKSAKSTNLTSTDEAAAAKCTLNLEILQRNKNSLQPILDNIIPEQIHLSWNGLAESTTVTWNTAQVDGKDHHTLVVWGTEPDRLNRCTKGTAWKFTDGGELTLTQYIHTVTLQYADDERRFKPSAANGDVFYYYRVGSENVLSNKTYKFRPFPSTASKKQSQWQPHLLVVGDLGTTNSRSLIEMTKQAVQQQHEFDLILHNGDYAYDMAEDNGRNGDAFMRLIETLAAYVPYQTTVGNHEHKYNFSHYTNRFGKGMPGSADGFYYTMDLGPLLFVIAISTEFHYFPQYGMEQIFIQHAWLEKELKKFRDSNSTQWLVVAGHRPMYCSVWDPLGCNPWGSIVRNGIKAIGVPGIEQLFRRYGVDLYIGAHEHIYERMWPVYDTRIMNGTVDAASPYTDPLATVYVVTGAGGNRLGQDSFYHRPFANSAFRTRDYGFTRLKAFNATHLHLDQISIEAGGKVVDEMWLKKTKHLPAWLRKKRGRILFAAN